MYGYIQVEDTVVECTSRPYRERKIAEIIKLEYNRTIKNSIYMLARYVI